MVFYRSFYEAIKELPLDVQAKVYSAIFEYSLNFNEVVLEGLPKTIFTLIKPQLDANKDFNVSETKRFHWNWKGGISTENNVIRNSTMIKKWRISVFKRDNYTCKHCNKVGGNLNAHHIKGFAEYPNLRFELSNGITLCKKCHIIEHKRLRNDAK